MGEDGVGPITTMSDWTTHPLPPRLHAGQYVFIRARVIGNSEHGVGVQLVDRWGKPVDNAVRYVPEPQIITVGEALKAVNKT